MSINPLGNGHAPFPVLISKDEASKISKKPITPSQSLLLKVPCIYLLCKETQWLVKGNFYNAKASRKDQILAIRLAEIIKQVDHFFWYHFKDLIHESRFIPPLYFYWITDRKFSVSINEEDSFIFSHLTDSSLLPAQIAHCYFKGVCFHLKGNNQQTGQDEREQIIESMANIFSIVFKHSLKKVTKDWRILPDQDLSIERHYKDISILKNSSIICYSSYKSQFLTYAFYLNQYKTVRVDPDCKKLLKIWGTAFFQLGKDRTFKNFAKKTIKLAEKFGKDWERGWGTTILSTWIYLGLPD